MNEKVEGDPEPVSSRMMWRRESTSGSIDDHNIQATNDEAAECKRAAVHMGYWFDPYIETFFHQKVEKKDPEINRGYWARVRVVRMLLNQFLKIAGEGCQIVNIGCGFDTLYWTLCDSEAKFSNFTDVDFSSVTTKKIRMILKKDSALKDNVFSNESEVNVDSNHTDLHAPRYHVVGADLRQKKELHEKLSSAGLDMEKPTVFISECVLIYMSTEQSEDLLRNLAEWFPASFFINYEQVNLDDKFGEVMKENLHGRGITLAGMKACRSLEEQENRFEKCGWKHPKAWTMDHIFKTYLPHEEVEKAEKIEFLDEIELLWQLLHHYCISIASRDLNNAFSFERITLI